MGNKMLIDATHPEETRVVVTRGNRVEEFDYESATRKQLRGNIYLAKVARIEPSLQAAFVNYGGNRHGFLAFAEIHPDYYQIPVAVREAIMKEDALDRLHGVPNGDIGHSENGQATEAEHKLEGTSEEWRGEQADAAPSEAGEAQPEAAPEAAGVSSLEAGAEVSPEAPAEPESPAEPAPAPARKLREAPMPLEAALPAVIYEEFAAAVARGEEARDEIPAHPDDVESPDEQEEAQAAPAQEPAEAPESQSEEPAGSAAHSSETSGDSEEHEHWEHHKRAHSEGGGVISVPEAPTPAPVEVVGSEDALEELPQRHKRRWRHYKIQEVIKRNQIVLIQVVKEERGTKGAALTTYLSLAGRYTVLMPNTPSGGGISRKITVPADRKRLKEIAQELEVPEGMGLIIRTAGASRTKAEIKRDFEYLLRLWETVRDLTLKSTAPCLVYEEGNLIKRSIRDLYNKDIDEVLVAGDDAHREAKEFMRMLMPSHAKNVIQYKDPEPLFTKYEVERQLNQMFSPVVTLKSGGYIVLNQTEALVAIDVNSGRATREYSIEDTALKTNLEASDEVARQVRLRDLAGLIVIDYIDMDERRNNRAVERRLKEALRHDRARIQVGHISHFGLMEMSRQRLRQGVVEVSTMPCPVCQGVGHIRSTESVALMILRSIEDHLRTQGAADLTVSASTEASLYILNHKRAYLRDIEMRYGVTIVIQMDENALGGTFTVTRGSVASAPSVAVSKAVQMEPSQAAAGEDGEEEESADGDGKRPLRRKRRRRRGRGEPSGEPAYQNGASAAFDAATGGEGSAEEEADEEDEPGAAESAEQPALSGHAALQAAPRNGGDSDQDFHRGRRRGRRGGRRHRDELAGGTEFSKQQSEAVPGLGEQPVLGFDLHFPKSAVLGPINREPAIRERPAAEPGAAQEQSVTASAPQLTAEAPLEAAPQPELQQPEANPAAAAFGEAAPEPAFDLAPAPEAPAIATPVPAPKPKPAKTGPRRKGWWQRRAG
ncbi:MAG: Rne/Rng family ribonuclease [Rhodomicrobium sp.]